MFHLEYKLLTSHDFQNKKKKDGTIKAFLGLTYFSPITIHITLHLGYNAEELRDFLLAQINS